MTGQSHRTGLVHLYTGDGKGKTTAAIGLAMRAAGRGRRVLFLQFLKGRESGELYSLALIPNIVVLRLSRDYGFVSRMSDEELRLVRNEHDEILATAHRILKEDDLLILDEVAPALRHGLLDEPALLNLIDSRPPNVELVLTGRHMPAALVGRADYITEMRKVMHPFDQGIAARKGIEW